MSYWFYYMAKKTPPEMYFNVKSSTTKILHIKCPLFDLNQVMSSYITYV